MSENKAKITKKDAPKHVKAKAPKVPKEPRRPKKRRGNTVGIVIALALVAALFLGAAMVALHVKDLDTIYPGVSFYGLELGGMTVTQAGDALEEAGYGAGENTVSVKLLMNHSLEIPVKDAVKCAQPIEAAAALFEYGREGNLGQNLVSYLRCRVNGTEIPLSSVQTVDAEYVKNMVSAQVQKANADLMGESLKIGETEITAVKGAKSVILDETAIYTLVMNALESGEYGEKSYTPQQTGKEDVDLKSIFDTVHKEAKDAEYDPENHCAGEHTVGVTFDLDKAQKAWDSAAAGEKITIPLIITEPEITREMLDEKLFADILGESKTSLKGSSKARINNVELACKSINEMVLNPGDEFSYNTALGKRTVEAGYQAAGAYNNGEVVSEVGGGICQVSSSLYYSALLSNLQITNRTCHYFAVAYLPLGLDATVSWGGPEFKFVNNREYPVKIEAYVDGIQCVVRIVGTDTDGSYVVMQTETWVNSDESTGARSYRLVYDAAGNLLSRTKEADSRYHVHKDEEETPTPEPSATPEVSPELSPEPAPEPGVTPEASPEVSPLPSPEVSPQVTETPANSLPASGSDFAA